MFKVLMHFLSLHYEANLLIYTTRHRENSNGNNIYCVWGFIECSIPYRKWFQKSRRNMRQECC